MAGGDRLVSLPTALPSGPGEIAREIRVAAPPEVVFSYFTDPSRLVRWQGTSAELDPRPGGLFRVNFASGLSVSGRYVEVVPPTTLVYTWGWEAEGAALPPGASTVEISLEPAGDDTLLRVRHDGLPEAMFEFHRSGWDECLAELARVLALPED